MSCAQLQTGPPLPLTLHPVHLAFPRCSNTQPTQPTRPTEHFFSTLKDKDKVLQKRNIFENQGVQGHQPSHFPILVFHVHFHKGTSRISSRIFQAQQFGLA